MLGVSGFFLAGWLDPKKEDIVFCHEKGLFIQASVLDKPFGLTVSIPILETEFHTFHILLLGRIIMLCQKFVTPTCTCQMHYPTLLRILILC